MLNIVTGLFFSFSLSSSRVTTANGFIARPLLHTTGRPQAAAISVPPHRRSSTGRVEFSRGRERGTARSAVFGIGVSEDQERDPFVGDGISNSSSEEDRNTVTTIGVTTNASGDRFEEGREPRTTTVTITLIGTAHLSQKSARQVRRLIGDIQPDILLVELDPSRLRRIGIYDGVDGINVDRVVASASSIDTSTMSSSTPYSSEKDDGKEGKSERDSIARAFDVPPPTGTSRSVSNPLQVFLQEVAADILSRIARVLLTGMYEAMSDAMGDGGGSRGDGDDAAADTARPGGEFLAAIRSAEECERCRTVILGDRDSRDTIKRAITLALQSGDIFGVLTRLQEANREELDQLEGRVRTQLLSKGEGSAGGDDERVLGEGEVNVAMMEALKEDSEFRNRLFSKLERRVPEFTQAFLVERDYIMAESIRREVIAVHDCSQTLTRVVAVVGLAHVAGMKANLLAMFDTNEEA